MCNIPEEPRSHLQKGSSLKPPTINVCNGQTVFSVTATKFTNIVCVAFVSENVNSKALCLFWKSEFFIID